ncbi:hypothetical protein FW778_22630 [Ginsengibacter hankyongi]|uniref:Uncharacterized protein n=1 Tax=Ginsengibacter hankyongi TaxID=2607284 RepID=A0A5J5IBV2_9BACT|nr:hypothetical protein [Ginsengibacter hankyongi]KAA9034365.1 hypothetical protein FW778_22630 [Ginsengibacter hankyongi]
MAGKKIRLSRRKFLALTGKAGAVLSIAPIDLIPGSGTGSEGYKSNNDIFRKLLERLRESLLESLTRSKIVFGSSLKLHSPSVSATYRGIWPDDFLYPMMVQPDLYNKEELTAIARFLTESIVDLPCFPDRVEADGMPVMQPGSLNSPHAIHMPLHLPAAWIRLIDHLEKWGAEIPRKEDWARIFERSMELVPFSCGLAYIDPQHPGVDFGFHDPEAITGFVLMSSMILHFGLTRAARFFDNCIDKDVTTRWTRLAKGIPENLYRLFDKEEGAFLAGSKDCRQVNVWGNGLAYWMVEPAEQKSIVDWYRKHRDDIFLKGFTRQIAEKDGWQRQLVNVPLGSYTNGGFWSIGTGWVLPAIAHQDIEFAVEIAKELVANVEKLAFPEWIDSKGAGGAMGFLAGIAGPMMGLTAIVEQRPFSDYF